jgi:hypothetical protein
MRMCGSQASGYSADIFKGSVDRRVNQASWQRVVPAISNQSQRVGHVVIEGVY